MNSRDKVLSAIKHKETDKIPLDLGSSFVTGIHKIAYINLMKYLNKNIKDLQFLDTLQQLVFVDESLLKELDVDVRGIIPNIVRKDPQIDEKNGAKAFTDEWGVRWEMPEGSLYFNLVKSPLSGEITENDIEEYPFPNTSDPKLLDGLDEKAKKYYDDGYAVILESVCAGIFEMCCRIRGTQDFLIDLAINPELACRLMDKLVDLKIEFYKMASKQLGQYIQFIREGDDVAGQKSMMISLNMYRKLIKPRHERLFKAQKELFPQPFFVFFHSDGQIYDVLPDFIEIGMDILNPVQITGKDLSEIKREFGEYISFWGGGCDTQNVLPFGTVDDVKKDVQQRIEKLSSNGGFIFCTVHNIQADVSPQNIMAMYETYKNERNKINRDNK